MEQRAAVIPIQKLLARILWDPEFGGGRFEIVYFDRKRKSLVRVPLGRIRMDSGRFGFEAAEDDGSSHSVPYHRVREVWRDGELIWSRGKSARG